MANNFYGAISLIGGGTGALDAIDGAGLADLDAAFVQVLNEVYFYTLDDDSGAAEDSPNVISPDTNAGTKRWILQNIMLKDGTGALPSIAFGSEKNMGFYRQGSAVIGISIGGASRFNFNVVGGGQIRAGGSAGAILNESVSATNPTVVPNVDDIDNGLGLAAADQLSLIAGGVEGIRISEAAGVITNKSEGALTVDSNAANTVKILALENTAGAIDVFRTDATPEGAVTGSIGDVAIDSTNGKIYLKVTGSASNIGWQEVAGSRFGEMHLHDNVTVTPIGTANIPHFIQGLFSGVGLSGWTFAAGGTDAITAFADGGGGQVIVTSAGHGLSNGDIISISGTTSYNGIFTISNVDTNDFEITDTWVADDGTGNWYQGDRLIAGTGAIGNYKLDWHAHGSSAVANKDFEYNIYKNATEVPVCDANRRFSATDTGVIGGGGGIVTIVDGDIIEFTIMGLTDTTNFTFGHCNVVLHKI